MKFYHIRDNAKTRFEVTEAGDTVFFLSNISGRFEFIAAHPEARVHIFGVYIGRAGDDFDLLTTQHHTAPGSFSNLLIRGVFYDNAQFRYSGLIKIEKEAQHVEAMQTNRNLVLSKKTIVKSEPYLEILADDVKCKHASATGQLNPDELYYLTTRGIAKADAEKLLAEGFVSDVFERVVALGGTKLEQLRTETLKKMNHEALFA